MSAIGIDIGSSNVKAVLVDPGGRLVASAARALSWGRRASEGGQVAELDADALWDAVMEVLVDLGTGDGAATLGEVHTIGVCGQYSSIVPVDADGRPVAPMRLYLDTRGTRHCQAILERYPDAFMAWIERHPVPPVGGGLALGHLLAIQHDHPAIHEATVAYLEPVDYVTTRLTGRATATQGSVFAGQLVDNRTLGVTAYDDELMALAGVDPARLPALVAADATVGEVRTEVARTVGLPHGVAVAAGMTDSHAAALATGADRPGRVGIAVGTTGVVLDTTDSMGVDLDHEVLAMPGVRAGEYLVWAENGLAGRAVEHVLDRLVHADDPLGSHATSDPFAGFEGALAASVPGAGGVRFLPWLSGSMAPQADGAMRGGFVGVSLDTERVDLVRATAEGVAHNLRWVLGPVEALSGTPATEVVLTGGAPRSPGWAQVLADVLDRPVRTLADPQLAGALAVATWARAVVAGESGGVDKGGTRAEGAERVDTGEIGERPGLGTRWADRYEPDPAATAIHDRAHEQFVATFEALRPLRLGQASP
ncbi:FGGY-family carbohydrate kinase [soil metagenome]